MRFSISDDDLRIILQEADTAARRLLRELRLSRNDFGDLRQDLLVDLIGRLRLFDPKRGSIGAFAGVILTNRAARIAVKVRHHRRMFGVVPVSLDEVIPNSDGKTRGELVPEAQGLAAALGYRADPIQAFERRTDFERGVGTLEVRGRRVVAALLRGSPHRLAKAGLGSRSELYRQLREIRLTLLAAGVGAACP